MVSVQMHIGGAPVVATDTFDVINPATGEVFATAPSCSPDQLDAAVTSAHQAFQSWRLDERVRRRALLDAADALLRARDRLASILTLEQGKPLQEAAREVDSSARWLRYYANLELEASPADRPEGGRVAILHRPFGVVAAITPWNFPLTLATWKIAPALRAGNTMVLKPSPYTPLATLAMGEILQQVLPAGVLNVVSGPDPLGATLTNHPLVRKISFTGSTATGRRVAAAAADDLKRVTLELGGNDAAVILPDVDPEAVAEQLFWSAFRNNGQICVAVKRVYAHERIHRRLVDALAAVAKEVRVGNGSDPETQLGPVNNEAQLKIVEELVDDARQRGAIAATGGARAEGPGYFYPPTILTEVPMGARIVDEEQFGPALPVLSYRDVDDAVARANATPYGLTASVWSADEALATEIAPRLNAGQVSVNAHAAALRPDLPLAGHRWSGVGVENGPWGLLEYTQPQVIAAAMPPR